MAKENEEKYAKNRINSIKRVGKAFNDLKFNLGYGGLDVGDKIDQRIDRSLEKLVKYHSGKSALNYAETLKTLMSKGAETYDLTEDVGPDVLSLPENTKRFARYANADEIAYKIPYCGRAVKVLSDGIVSPDNITKESITLLIDGGDDSDDLKEMKSRVQEISEQVGIEGEIHGIVHETLKLGDSFIEICDYKSEEIPLTQTQFLTESITNNKPITKESVRIMHERVFSEDPIKLGYDIEYYKDLRRGSKVVKKKYNNEGELNIKTMIYEDINIRELNEFTDDPHSERLKLLSEDDSDKKKEIEVKSLQDVRIIFHDPTKIVKLQSRKYKTCLGYLVFPDIDESTMNSAPSLSANGPSAIYGAQSGSGSLSHKISGLNFSVNSGLDELYRKIIFNVKSYLESSKDVPDDIEINKDDLKQLLDKTIKYLADEGQGEMKIRYVPNNRMQHFYINNKMYFPYGEGIFEKTMFEAKLLIALETATIIRRVSDSSDKRLIYIEDSPSRQTTNYIEALKEALQKRKYSINSFNDISTIPTMITSYEDYIIPQRGGRRFVEFDTLPPQVQIRDATEELKSFRDSVVSSLEVPPAFLNIEDNLSNKAVLSHESSLFANTIVSYQKVFSDHLDTLFFKLYSFIFSEPLSDEIKITFPPPEMLYIERKTESIEIASRLVDTLAQHGIPVDYLREKYIPVDWEEIKQRKVEHNIDKRRGHDDEEDMQDDGFAPFSPDPFGGMGGPGPPPPPPGGGMGGGMGGF